MSVNVCLDDIFWTTEHFVTKLGVVMQHHRPECSVEKKWSWQSMSRSQQRVRMSMFVQMILLNQQTFRCQTWYCDASSWAGVSCIWSRSHQGFTWSKYDSFYYIFWTVDPFVTKLAFIVHYHKPVCLLMKLDCCFHDLRPVYPWQWEQKTKYFQFKLHTFLVDNLFWLCSGNVHNGPLFWCSHGFSLFPGCAEWSAYTTKGQ